jgi:hypothetical protein
MHRLQWTRRETGWRAGRYSIELLAPGFWVLSRYDPSRDPSRVEILASSGSRSVLVGTAAHLEHRRRRRRRVAAWSGVLVFTIAGLVVAYLASVEWAGAVLIGCSTLAVYASIRVMDALVDHSWESIKSAYQ